MYLKKLSVFLGEPEFAMKFNDNKVCKSFLVGCCPHDILATTVSTQIRNFLSFIDSLLEVFIGNTHKVSFCFDDKHLPVYTLFYLNLINFHH